MRGLKQTKRIGLCLKAVFVLTVSHSIRFGLVPTQAQNLIGYTRDFIKRALSIQKQINPFANSWKPTLSKIITTQKLIENVSDVLQDYIISASLWANGSDSRGWCIHNSIQQNTSSIRSKSPTIGHDIGRSTSEPLILQASIGLPSPQKTVLCIYIVNGI